MGKPGKQNMWLRLLRDSNTLEKRLAESLLDDCEEILRILGSILKTLKNVN